jgi:hypothetical protein
MFYLELFSALDRHKVDYLLIGGLAVSFLVVRRQLPLRLGQHHAATLGAEHDLVLRVLEVRHVDLVTVAARGEERALIDQVREVRATHPRRALGEHLDLDVVADRDLPQMHAQDAFAPLDVRRVNDDLPVEAARTEQRGVEHIRTVRRGQQDHAVVRLEAVHLDEQLVERLLALVVSAAETGAPMTADGIDLVDEDDARRVCLALLEEVAHA